MAQSLLGAGRGLSLIGEEIWAATSPSSDQTVAQRKAAAQAFEKQLQASLPSDLTKLVLQIAEERDAFVARTVLAARLPGWEEITLADIIMLPLRSGIVKLSARTATSNAECVFKIPSQSVSGAARVRAVHQALSDAGVASKLLASGVDWTVEQLLTARELCGDWTPR